LVDQSKLKRSTAFCSFWKEFGEFSIDRTTVAGVSHRPELRIMNGSVSSRGSIPAHALLTGLWDGVSQFVQDAEFGLPIILRMTARTCPARALAIATR